MKTKMRFHVLPFLLILFVSFNATAKSNIERNISSKMPTTCTINGENNKLVDVFDITGVEINKKNEVIGYKVEHVDRSKINNLRVSLLGMSLSYGSLPDGPTRIDAKKTIDETVKKLESMQPITTYGSILITESYILFKADGYLKRYPSTVTLECN